MLYFKGLLGCYISKCSNKLLKFFNIYAMDRKNRGKQFNGSVNNKTTSLVEASEINTQGNLLKFRTKTFLSV
jgi:hypothetical protein